MVPKYGTRLVYLCGARTKVIFFIIFDDDAIFKKNVYLCRLQPADDQLTLNNTTNSFVVMSFGRLAGLHWSLVFILQVIALSINN